MTGRHTLYRWAVVATLALLAGCGGGGRGPGGTDNGTVPVTPGGTSKVGTAQVHVDVQTGQVTVSPLNGGRAVLAGSTMGLETSTLFDQPGNSGLRVIRVALRNQSGLPIGQLADGTLTGLRAFVGDFTNLATPNLDLQDQVTVSPVAGTGVAGWLDGSALAGKLSGPRGLAMGPDGSIYETDYTTCRIRQLHGSMLSTVAGTGAAGIADGVATVATFRNPWGIAYNPSDDSLVVVDLGNACLRRVSASGLVSRIAGTGTAGFADGAGSVAQFYSPREVAVSASGVIYVADMTNHRVRQVVLTGPDPTSAASYTVSTLAGQTSSGLVDGVGAAAKLNQPFGLAIDGSGNVYVSENGSHVIRRVTPDGVVTRVAGTGGGGTTDGIGDAASFTSPWGLAWTSDGLVVAENGANKLRLVSLRAGASPTNPTGWVVRTLTAAAFSGPCGVTSDSAGNVYVADSGGQRIQLVVPTNGHLSLDEPNGSAPSEPVTVANPDGFAPGTGMGTNTPYLKYDEALDRGATSATKDWAFDIPAGVKAFEFTVLVEADTSVPAKPPAGTSSVGSHGGYVWTLAGSGSTGFVNGVGSAARFHTANGLALAADGTVYVADTWNHAIRRVSRDGTVVTIAGLSGATGSANGTGSEASFDEPVGVALSPDGSKLFVADFGNELVRMLALAAGASPTDPANWTVSTVAGVQGSAGYVNGAGNVAQFSGPSHLALDAAGTLYLTEGNGNRVRALQSLGGDQSLATNWLVSLVAGQTDGSFGTTNGDGAVAEFTTPMGIAVGPHGDLFVADNGNSLLRRIVLPGTVSTVGVTVLEAPRGVAVDSSGFVFAAGTYGVARYSLSGSALYVYGQNGTTGSANGPGDVALDTDCRDLGIAPSGTVVVLALGGNAIRLVERTVSTGTP